MFYNKYKKTRAGDIISKADVQEIADRITFLSAIQNKQLKKAKSVLRLKSINVENTNSLSELAAELNKAELQKTPKPSRFSGNIVDVRDMINDNEIILVIKAGSRTPFGIYVSDLTSEWTLEWEENGVKKKNFVKHASTTTFTAPNTGLTSADGSFKYTLLKITSGSPITRFVVPWGAAGTGMTWFVSKGINFEEIWFNASDYMIGDWGYQHLTYVDILNGGTKHIRANGCGNLIEIEADWINMNTTSLSAKQMFDSCINLKTLPENTRICSPIMHKIFNNCNSLEKLPILDFSISVDNAYALNGCRMIEYFPNNTLKINKNSDCGYFAQGCSSLKEIPNIVYGKEELGAGNNFIAMFKDCTSATKIPFSLDLQYCKRGLDMAFYNCSSIIDGPSEIKLYNDITDSSVFGVDNFFGNCSSLRSIATTITSANIIAANNMFKGCESLKRAPRLNFIRLRLLTSAFEGCSTLVQCSEIMDFPYLFDAKNVFKGCKLLQAAPQTINIPFAKLTTEFFNGCSAMVTGPKVLNLKTSIDNFKFFYDCSRLESVGEPGSYIVFNDIANNASFFGNCSALATCSDFKGGMIYSGFFDKCSSLAIQPKIEISPGIAADLTNCFKDTIITNFDFNKLIAPDVRTLNGLLRETPNLTTVTNTNFDVKYPKCNDFSYMFRNTKIVNLIAQFPNCSGILFNEVFSYNSKLETLDIDIKSKNVYIFDMLTKSNMLRSLKIKGNFENIMNIGAVDTSASLEELVIDTPNLINFSGSARTDRFTGLTSCKVHTNIHAVVIINSKTLTDIDLSFSNFNIIEGNILISINNNNFNTEVLNRIMTELPDINNVPKEDETYLAYLNIAGNPGTTSCNTSIATNKGWTVM